MVIGDGGIGPQLREPLRLIRRYCVRFLDRVGASEDRRDPGAATRYLFREHRWRMHDFIAGDFRIRQIRRKPVLSGLINEYERAA
jgi:hypothetical protein